MVGWIGRLMGHMKKTYCWWFRNPARITTCYLWNCMKKWDILHINCWPLDFWTIMQTQPDAKIHPIHQPRFPRNQGSQFPFQKRYLLGGPGSVRWRLKLTIALVELLEGRWCQWCFHANRWNKLYEFGNLLLMVQKLARTPPLGCINLVNNGISTTSQLVGFAGFLPTINSIDKWLIHHPLDNHPSN